MTRARLPWLLALPLIVGGSLAAHALGYASPPAPAEKHELAEAHERLSAGYAGHSVMWLGMLAAIFAAPLVIALARRARGATRRGAGACAFFLMPLVAYSSQELIERLLDAESFPFQAALEPRFLLGLALQLPFALAAFALGWLLLRLGTRLLRLLARQPRPNLRRLLTRTWTPQRDFTPPIPALARGHPLRGPPLLA